MKQKDVRYYCMMLKICEQHLKDGKPLSGRDDKDARKAAALLDRHVGGLTIIDPERIGVESILSGYRSAIAQAHNAR